jgi:copper chaperone
MMQTIMMNVTGMKCGGCPIKLARALREVAGVTDVQVSLASGEVTVRYDQTHTSSRDLKVAVVGTGFGVDQIAATNGHDPRPNYCG